MAKEAQVQQQLEKRGAREKETLQQQSSSRQGKVVDNPLLQAQVSHNPLLQTSSPAEILHNPHTLTSFRLVFQPQTLFSQTLVRPEFRNLPRQVVPLHLWPPPLWWPLVMPHTVEQGECPFTRSQPPSGRSAV